MDASSTTDLNYGRSRSASDARSLNHSLFAYPSTPPRHSSDLTNDPSTSFSRPGTHRSTHSSPALSPPSPPTTGRARSSTLRSIFTRNGSSSMLSSSPGAVSGSGRSPYGQGNGSTARLASASSASISSQSISAPLQHTLVSSSFVFPKSGPTASQIAFISSRESLGAYGYGDGVAQIPGYEEGSSPTSEPAPITSSSSMTVPVVGGRFRASSVSSQLSIGSSPLARTVSAPEPASPVVDDSEGSHRLPLPTDPPIPSYDELHPSPPAESPLPTSAPSPPPTMTLTLPPPLSISIPTDDSPSSTPLNSAFATPRSHSPSPGNASVAHTPKTGNPPTLPALVFYNATPTASTAPSPIIPGGAYDEERIPSGGSARREQNFSTM
ncbi:hypothetical protein BCR35DRAFT_317739 [Leucosporidium creatinivorum]|uniref:Uncharacterized protein n=1 Tax=Leucosporidium creatinivorum TaxID=106004 RepID=A0A1Y2FU11_9BASI|nr:hypothetical protein BCR35DRAFT_317739 [Leucosporidium creatinivorum]